MRSHQPRQEFPDDDSRAATPSTLDAFCVTLSHLGFRAEGLIDKGTVERPEDCILVNTAAGIVGVVDGVDGFFPPSVERPMYFDQTGGQFVGSHLNSVMQAASSEDSLRQLVIDGNRALGEILEAAGLDLRESEKVPGAVGVIAKVDRKAEVIHLVCWGDVLALWQNFQGEVFHSRNQVLAHDLEYETVVAELMTKYNGDRSRMWEEYIPILTPARRERVNNPHHDKGFGLFNGQEEFGQMIQEIVLPMDRVHSLMLVGDGFVGRTALRDIDTHATRILSSFREQGLHQILQGVRAEQESQKRTSHVHLPEATAFGMTRTGEDVWG